MSKSQLNRKSNGHFFDKIREYEYNKHIEYNIHHMYELIYALYTNCT